jgi:hypothetical protein
VIAGAVAFWLGIGAAGASPWAEVGDSQLRSDVQILANAGVVDDITSQWPIPWAGLVSALKDQVGLATQPVYVREAARRVLAYATSEMHRNTFAGTVFSDFTNLPSVVRGFDALGRNKGESVVSAEYMDSDTALRISVGAWTDFTTHSTHYNPDGTYIAQKIGGAVIYAGYLSQWWGPGWISALSLSNNARPFPQVGIERLDSSAFRSPLLSWLGPWQMQFLVGWLDDQRVAMNTAYDGLRLTFNPIPGLQIGLARTQQLCGTGHPCVPLAEYFEFTNQSSHVNRTNDEGVIDLHYQNTFGAWPFEVYTQLMNEDSNPITHSVTSHLFGASVWIPVARNSMRITLEYTDTVPTVDIFSFGKVFHGSAYNNSDYIDGMRYRGRTLGFSLDSDSRLLTLQSQWIDNDDWSYELTVHHAIISNPNNSAGNVVTTAPVIVNMGEARISIPFKGLKLDVAARLQDDQPRPDKGFTGAIEAALTADF